MKMYKLKEFIKRLGRFLLKGLPVNHVTAKIVTIPRNDFLKGRNVLITGGTSGIGLAIARSFLNAGACVIITGRDLMKLQAIQQELNSQYPGCVYAYRMDNMQVSAFEAGINEILSLLPDRKIDVLVNNAGVETTAMPHVTEEDYDKVLDTNLKGAFFLSQQVGKYMVEHHIQGNILNISSSSSLRPANSPYMLSKWGVRALTLGLAKSLIPHGIVVNSIAPGPTQTPMVKGEDTSDLTLDSSPIGRYIKPEEVAQMAVVLVSEMGRTIVGDTIYMTGGLGNLTVDDYNGRYAFK